MSKTLLSRRDAAGLFLALGGGLILLGCGGDSDNGTTAGGTDTGTGGTDTGTGGTDTGTATSDTTPASEWASGGTKSMTDKASYPNPFATAATSCALFAQVTEGPCTEAADQVRVDISEGYTGLPMRLALQVVDTACKPIAGAKVKIWHTQITGSYSGNTPNNGMCLKDAADSSKHYFRGVQTSDADGRVDFDSCFPGWYRGRAVHIHFTVTVDGKSSTSQLVFDQALVTEIFTNHAEYKGYGQPDTPNATDNVVRGNVEAFTLTTARMSDGAMLASKVLVVG